MATKEDFERLGAWAVMLNPDANLDRRGARRVVPMEVLSLGMSRTGTLSMMEAYQILGYPNPYHYSSIFRNIRDCDMWIEALKAKYQGIGKPYGRAEFDQLLGHCGAITDTPSIIFWKELMEAYPKAKIILVERDEKKWLDSVSVLLEEGFNPFGMYVLRFTDPAWFGRVITVSMLYMKGLFGSLDYKTARGNALDVYRQHNKEIRETVPKDRILIYKLGSGWDPLCEFLGKEIPDVPFPRRNEANVLRQSFAVAINKSLRNSTVNISAVVGIGSVLGTLVWKYSGLL